MRVSVNGLLCFMSESESDCEWITNGVIGGFVVTPCTK